ncbi:hypothetical protein ACWE42_16765 [Sutcliffiella cohnii]
MNCDFCRKTIIDNHVNFLEDVLQLCDDCYQTIEEKDVEIA